MKKLLLSLSCIFVFNFLHAQSSSNLGFSQVLNFEYIQLISPASISPALDTLVVPAGKVWKITSGSAYNSQALMNGAAILVGYNVICGGRGVGYDQFSHCPVWLSSGNYEVYMINDDTGNHIFRGALTIIEFNIE